MQVDATLGSPATGLRRWGGTRGSPATGFRRWGGTIRRRWPRSHSKWDHLSWNCPNSLWQKPSFERARPGNPPGEWVACHKRRRFNAAAEGRFWGHLDFNHRLLRKLGTNRCFERAPQDLSSPSLPTNPPTHSFQTTCAGTLLRRISPFRSILISNSKTRRSVIPVCLECLLSGCGKTRSRRAL